MNDDLRLIVLENACKLGTKVNNHLNKLNNNDNNYIIPINNDRFKNGEGKIVIKGSVREKDVYIISDVGNYDISYNLHGFTNHMSPDDHFVDIKRVISAMSGHAKKITVIMPLLYQARQHKRRGRESLDCAVALQELEKMGVNNIITFDAHDPNIANAIPSIPFDSFYPTELILKDLEKEIDKDNLMVISPDMGAMERAKYYAEKLNCDVGVFYKRRDLSKVINGKNPIIEHTYMGSDVENKDIIIVDDMIASGASMIEVAEELKNRKANKIYLVSTFALFTEGIDKFIEAYKNNLFNKLYTTNLSYVSTYVTNKDWCHLVDCSSLIADIINTLHEKESLEKFF